MDTPTMELSELKTRVDQLEQKLFRLEARVALPDTEAVRVSPRSPSTSEDDIWADLLARGIIRKPTPTELALAAEWRALPEAEKEAVRQELDNLNLNPSASEIIHMMREGWYPDESEWVSE